MGYSANMAEAARRNLSAGNCLKAEHLHVAGYLFGIAAECALKAMMLEGRMKPSPSDSRSRDDPFYAHFPELKTLLRDQLQGRAMSHVARLVADDAFLNQWAIEIRYAGKGQVPQAWVERWQEQAKSAVNQIGT